MKQHERRAGPPQASSHPLAGSAGARVGRGAPGQRGAALLTALIIVALVATLAAAMVWRQFRALEVEGAERSRMQSEWMLLGALDWSRLILREDARANQGTAIDHLGEVWAVPLAETRLSTFLAAEGDGMASAEDAEDGPQAFLSGTIADAQALYNLRNLVSGTPANQAIELRTLERLCVQAGCPAGTARDLATKLRQALAGGNAGGANGTAPVPPNSLEQLRWLGLEAATIERLRPFVILLPAATPVNLNTASREVLAGLFSIDLASCERLLQQRKLSPFRTIEAARTQLPQGTPVAANRASVNSSYFIIEGRLRLDDRVLQERSLVVRNGVEIRVLSRERVSQVLDPSPT